MAQDFQPLQTPSPINVLEPPPVSDSVHGLPSFDESTGPHESQQSEDFIEYFLDLDDYPIAPFQKQPESALNQSGSQDD